MNKVTIAGNMLLDIVKQIECWPQRGMLVNITKISRAVGGCACNTPVDLKRLDESLEVSVYGTIGQDDNGKFLLDYMSGAGLNVSHVKEINLPTSFTDVMTLPNGERTFFHARGANTRFNLSEEEINGLDCDLFHLGYLLLLDCLDMPDEEYGTKAARLLKLVGDRGIKTSIDLVSEESDRFVKVVTPALKYCDYAVINEVEASRLTGIPATQEGKVSIGQLKKICERILSLGVRDTVAVHCPMMSCAMNRQGEFEVLPSLNLPEGYIAGAVGAGDAFCAGMLYSFVKGLSLTEGMRLASCSAACNLSVSDSVSGAKSVEESLKLEKKFGRRELC